MTDKIGLYKSGLEEYPGSTIIIENLAMIVWIVLGTIACWFFHPIAALIYVIFAIGMVCFVLRKLVCTNCYYYGRSCHLAWGKLSARFFKKGELDTFSNCIGLKLAAPTYGLLMIIPIILLIIPSLLEFSVLKIMVLILLVLFSSYSAGISRKQSCAKCKMRLCCPGSAAK